MKLQIPAKIGGVVAVLVVSLLALAAAGLSGIASVGEQADKLATVSVKKLEAVAELRGTTAGLRADAFETVIYDSEAKHDELERSFGENIAKGKSQLAEIRELSAGVPAQIALVDRVEKAVSGLETEYGKGNWRAASNQTERETGFDQIIEAFAPITANLNKLVANVDEKA